MEKNTQYDISSLNHDNPQIFLIAPMMISQKTQQGPSKMLDEMLVGDTLLGNIYIYVMYEMFVSDTLPRVIKKS